MTIRTPIELRLNQRRLDRKVRRFERERIRADNVMAEMRDRGHALHLHLDRRSGPMWSLSNGRRVDGEIARKVIQHSDIAGVGDALFSGTLSQTYRWTGSCYPACD